MKRVERLAFEVQNRAADYSEAVETQRRCESRDHQVAQAGVATVTALLKLSSTIKALDAELRNERDRMARAAWDTERRSRLVSVLQTVAVLNRGRA